MGLLLLALAGPARAGVVDVPSITYTTESSTLFGVEWECVNFDECELSEYHNGSWHSVDTTRSNSERTVLRRSPGRYKYQIVNCGLGSYGARTCSANTSSTVTTTVKRYPSSSPAAKAPSTSATGSFNVTWPSVAHADNYTIYERVNGGSWRPIGTQAGRSKPRSKGDGVYDYRVEACAGRCASAGGSDRVTVAIRPDEPASISVPSAVTDGAFGVSWSAVSGSNSYRLEQRKDSGVWSPVYSGSGRSYPAAVDSPGSYRYRVRACNTVSDYTSCSGWEYSAAVTAAKPAGAPNLNVPGSSKSGSYSVNWGSVDNSDRYTLQQRVNAGSWSTEQDNGDRDKGYNDQNNGQYGYRVRACNRLGCSAYSGSERVDVARDPGPPAGIDVPGGATDGDFGISWSSPTGSVSHYQLEQRRNSGSWASLDNNIQPGSRHWTVSTTVRGHYRYRVRACKTVGSLTNCSGWRTSGPTSVAPPASAPNLDLATQSGDGRYPVSWNSVDNTDRYELWERRGNNGWTRIQSGGSRSKTIDQSESGQYHYRVNACNDIGCSSFSSVQTIDVALRPGVPATISVPAGATDGRFTVSWGESSGRVSRYQLQERRDGGDWSQIHKNSERSKSRTLDGEGSYTYRVRACNTVGDYTHCSDWRSSDSVAVARPASAPGLSVPATSGDGSYSVSWTSTGNTSRYTLQERAGGGEWQTLQDDGAQSSDLSGKGNGQYAYRVRSCNALGCSDFTNVQAIKVALKPNAPAHPRVSVNPNVGQFAIEWDGDTASASVSFYQLAQRRTGEDWVVEYDGGHLRRGFDLSQPGRYEYRVRACRDTGGYVNCSAWSLLPEAVEVVGPPQQPIEVEAYPSGSGGVSLQWANPPANPPETVFESQFQINGGAWLDLASGTDTRAELETMGQGQYLLRVRACNPVNGFPNCSEWVNIPKPIAKPAAVPSLAAPAHSETGDYALSWPNELTGVKRYELEETHAGQSTRDPLNAERREYEGKTSGRYTYRVFACNDFGCSPPSETARVDVARTPGAPEYLQVPTLTDGAFDIKWGYALGEVDSYRLSERQGSGAWEQIHTEPAPEPAQTSMSTSRGGLSAGQYSYQVRACNTTGEFTSCSEPVSQGGVEVAAPQAAPGGLELPASVGGGNYTLSWTPVDNTRHYLIEERVDQGNWSSLPEVEAAQRDFTDRPEGRYSYRVKACNRIGCSPLSPVRSVIVVDRPGAVSAIEAPNPNDGRFELDWIPGGGEVSFYRLERQKGEGEWVPVGEPSAPGYAVTGLSAGEYRFRITACRSQGEQVQCSEPTLSERLQVAAPAFAPGQIILPIVSLSGQFEIDWEPVGNSRYYKLEERLSPDNNSDSVWQTLAEVAEPPYSIGKTANNHYQYRLSACNDLGCSAASLAMSIEVKLTPGEPGELVAEADPATGRSRLSWAELETEPLPDSYQLQQSLLGSQQWSPSQTLAGTSGVWSEPVSKPGRYQYRIKACRDMEADSYCSEWHLSNQVTYERPQTPELSLPSTSEDGRYTVSWNAGAQAVDYQLEENGQVSELEVTEQNYDGDTAKAPGVYHYRVKACNVLGCSDYSEPQSLTVGDANSGGGTGPDGGSSDGGDSDSGGDGGSGSGEDSSGGDEGSGSSGDSTGSGNDGSEGGDDGRDGLGELETGANLEPTGDYSTLVPAPEQGRAVGTLQGQFRVNEAGAASYEIPLDLPKGTADVTPQLAFSYNSQGGAGLLGQGWSLSGLSSISRCRQTLAQDGQARAIDWSAQDRLCLDGQRLVLVEGSYGAPGSVYRTEIDAYVRVTARGGKSGHPEHFEVTAKDGSLTRYGHRADARLNSPEGTLTWVQSQFEDSVGNRIDYRYTGGADTGFRISRIDYAYPTTNSSSGPRAQVVFDYSPDTRRDAQTRYVGGYPFHETRLLSEVTVVNTTDTGSPLPVERHTPIVVFAKLALVGFGNISAVFPHCHRR